MDQNSITRSIVEGLVDQYMEQIKRDPKRSIRKLVDMGGQFAKGRFQKQIISLMQAVLSNEKSPYYPFAQELIEQTDSDALKIFGVNMGLNSWTLGANVIREKEAELGFNIPWALTFHINDETSVFSPCEIRRLIREGKACGVYAYLLRFTAPNSRNLKLPDYLKIILENPDCAFVWFLPPEWVDSQFASKIKDCSNLMVSVDSSDNGWENALSTLKENHCLRAAHKVFDDQKDADDLCSGLWLERVILAGASFAFCFSGSNCPKESREDMQTFIMSIRNEQKYPAFPMDYYADHLKIDQIISDGPCYLGVLPDGTVTWYDGFAELRTKQNIENHSLLEILKNHPLPETK
jgi:hypothetical protein